MDEWDALQCVIDGYTTLDGLDNLSFDDIDTMCIARDVMRNAEADAAPEE